MIACANCGQENADFARVCRYCGTTLGAAPSATRQRDYVPPPPVWESQPAPVEPLGAQFSPSPYGYRCPRCGSPHPPQVEKRISSDGWIVFALLLFFCPPFFWIGLLMREEVRTCPSCGAKSR